LIPVKVKAFLIPIVIFVLFIATGCGGSSLGPTPTETPTTTPTIEDIVDTVSKAVVRIITREAMGSGMIIDEDGYIPTNSQKVSSGEIYETFVYNYEGTLHFSVSDAPQGGEWTLWVVKEP